eukprot:6174449-Pleurochrysis_carterae.AAC.1
MASSLIVDEDFYAMGLVEKSEVGHYPYTSCSSSTSCTPSGITPPPLLVDAILRWHLAIPWESPRQRATLFKCNDGNGRAPNLSMAPITQWCRPL